MTNKKHYKGLMTARTAVAGCEMPLCASQTKYNQKEHGLNSWQNDDPETIGTDNTHGNFQSSSFSVVFE